MSGAIPTDLAPFEDKDGGAFSHIAEQDSHFFDQFLSYDDSESFESSENSHGSNFFDFDFNVPMENSSGDSMADTSSARSCDSKQHPASSWRPEAWRSQLEDAARIQRMVARPESIVKRKVIPAIGIDSLFDLGTTPTPTPTPPAPRQSNRPLTPPQHTKANYAVRTPITPTHRITRPSANGPSSKMMRPSYYKPENDWAERFQHFTLEQPPHQGPLTPPNSGRVQQGAHVAPSRLVTSPFKPNIQQPETISPSLISPLSTNSAYTSFTSPVSPFYSDPFASDISASGLFISLPPGNPLTPTSTTSTTATTAPPANLSAYPTPPLPATKDTFFLDPDVPLPSIETDDFVTPFTPTPPSRRSSRRTRRARSTPSIFFSSSSPSPAPAPRPTPRKSASASRRSKSRASSAKSAQHRRNKSTPFGHAGVSKSGSGGSAQAGGGGFINFTPSDSRRILSGVAPSGSSKTKARREKEAFEKRRQLSERGAQVMGMEVEEFLALVETGRMEGLEGVKI